MSDYKLGDLNHGFECGNFFNLIEDPEKVVIQYITYKDKREAEEQDYEDFVAHELIADSLEQAVVAIAEIEQQFFDTKYAAEHDETFVDDKDTF